MKQTIFSKPAIPAQTVRNLYTSEALFRDQQEIMIEHAGYHYRLRVTRQNKLILTK